MYVDALADDMMIDDDGEGGRRMVDF